jgi:hypothetical protein
MPMKKVHERADQQDHIRSKPQGMAPMFTEEVEDRDKEERNAHQQ